MKKNDVFSTVTITGYASSGAGVARIGGQVVFVKNALDGEVCDIRILRVNRNLAYAKIEQLTLPSPQRIAPSCPSYGPCGGCDLLHMNYTEQLRFKHRRVADVLARVGGISAPIMPIIPAEDSHFRYRNKAIFAVGNADDMDFEPIIGFYQKRTHRIVTMDDCLLQTETANRAARVVRRWMAAHKIPAYNEATQSGIVRHLFVRQSAATNDTVVCIVARTAALPESNALITAIRRHCPEVTGIVLCHNNTAGNVVLDGTFRTLWGEQYLQDCLCGLTFQLAPRSFFQVNPIQTEKLYAQVKRYAALNGRETVLDFYCGTGTIALCLADSAATVIGVEVVPEAVRDAIENARKNGITNARFITSDVAAAAASLQKEGITPDVVIVDPARRGLDSAVIDAIAAMHPKRIIYVSCNPATLARDLNLFAEQGYKTSEVTPLDMFPQCAHVECVSLLER